LTVGAKRYFVGISISPQFHACHRQCGLCLSITLIENRRGARDGVSAYPSLHSRKQFSHTVSIYSFTPVYAAKIIDLGLTLYSTGVKSKT